MIVPFVLYGSLVTTISPSSLYPIHNTAQAPWLSIIISTTRAFPSPVVPAHTYTVSDVTDLCC